MADECPHRRAPLSRGRLFRPPPPQPTTPSPSAPSSSTPSSSTSSTSTSSSSSGVLLECAYHGWQFDGSGTCVRLPQMLPPGYRPQAASGADSGSAVNTPPAPAPAAAAPGAAAAGAAAPAVRVEPVAGPTVAAAATAVADSGPPRAAPTAPVAAPGAGSVATTSAGLPLRPPRSCSGLSYRTAVAQGMVWVWYGSNPAEADESTLPLDFAEEGSRRGEDWALVDVFTRDFPYDWETMVENVVDPAHVAFAHDGTGQGLDRHAAPPLELQVLESGPTGFSGRFRGVRSGPSPGSFLPGAWSQLAFRAPCLVSMRFSLPGKGDAGLVLYCVPLGRGRSRMIARLPRNFATGWRARLQPRWAKHLPRMAVLDQDIDLLREQEAAMARARVAARARSVGAAAPSAPSSAPSAAAVAAAAAANVPSAPAATAAAAATAAGGPSGAAAAGGGGGPSGAAAGTTSTTTSSSDSSDSSVGVSGGGTGGAGDWLEAYVMPAPADRFVIQFRRWLDRTGGSRPWAMPDCPTASAQGAAGAGAALLAAAANGGDALSREQVLDRYHSHVRSCSACSGALAAFQRTHALARVLALAALAAAAGLAAAAATATAAAAAGAASAAAAAGAGASAVALGGPACGAAACGAAGSGALVAVAAAAAGLVAAVAAAVAVWSGHMTQRFRYTEEGRELRMNEDRWLRRLLFSGTNSFNSMVALTNSRRAGSG